MWWLNNMLLKKTKNQNTMGQWRIQRENKKTNETNENKNTTFQHLWEATKAVLRGKSITIQALHQEIRKISSINSLILAKEELSPKSAKERT